MSIQRIKETVNIIDLAEELGISKVKSYNHYKQGTFRDENTPALTLYEKTNSFYDFSTGIGGDVISFVKYVKSCGTYEAIKFLKDYIAQNSLRSLKK